MPMYPAQTPRQRRVSTVASLALLVWLLVALSSCSAPRPPAPPPAPRPEVAKPEPTPARQTFEATAYSLDGTTASGGQARPGIVAADPRVLPLGSRIRVSGAGAYDGTYTVADTGRTIRGREIDLYIADDREARRFGRRQVEVEVLDRSAAE